MDFSCYVTITNNLEIGLTFSSKSADHGYWDINPPSTVAANTTSIQMRLADSWGPNGSGGGCVYSFSHPLESTRYLTLAFSCPTGNNDNTASGTTSANNLYQVTFRAKTDGNWVNNSCPTRGHPLYVEYSLGYKIISTSTNVASVLANGEYTIQNSAGTIVNYNTPIWQVGVNVNDGAGSLRPALFDVDFPANCLVVALSVDSALAGVGFRLVGALNSQKRFSSAVVTGNPGQQSIAVSFTSGNSIFERIQGNVSWQLEIEYSGQVIPLPTTTRVELYWIYNRPASMYNKGVWVKVLRMIAAGPSQNATANFRAMIVNICFKQFGFVYDTYSGQSYFDVSFYGDYVNLARVFLTANDSPPQECNCYDQAGILQSFLGAVGVGQIDSWAFMEPFGFIDRTDLIGWGDCNNPFFRGDVSRKVVPINDPNRTAFRNHAFLVQSAHAFDSCAGPHDGSETTATYLTASIDSATTLYSKYPAPYNRPGVASDIVMYPGIKSVESPPPMSAIALPNTRLTSAVTHRVPLAALRGDRRAGGKVEYDWTQLVEGEQIFGPNSEVTFDHIATGPAEGMREWAAKSELGEIRLQVRILQGGIEAAAARFQNIVAAISNDDPELFDISVNDLGHLAIASRIGERFILWVWCNAVFRLATRSEGVDLIGMARRIQALAESHTSYEDRAASLQIGEVRRSAETVAVGEFLQIGIPTVAGTRLDFALEGRALTLSAMSDQALLFKAVEAGEAEIAIIRADDKTLNVASTTIRLQVAGAK